MKKQIRAWLLAAAMLLSLAASTLSAAAAGTITVSQVSGATGEVVDVELRLSSDDVAAGSFTVRYDSAVLELVSATPSGSFQCVANPGSAGVVKVSFAQYTQVISDAVLCTLTFRITAQTDAQDGSPIVLEQVRLYDLNSSAVEASVLHGAVLRKTVRLRMSAAETAEYQAVRAIVHLEGGLSPAGGNFSLSYDPTHFSVRSVLPLKAAEGAGFTYHIVQPGLVKVSFSSQTALAAGELFAVVFQTEGSAGASSALRLSDVKMYDENGAALDVSVVNGSLSIVVPSDDNPKLWVIGGAMQEDGSATIAVVLQGRGYVCGGNFNLYYDSRMTATVTPAANCQVNHDAGNGKIQVAWAAETPFSGEAELLKVTFTSAVESDVTLDSATFYDKESATIAPVEVRPGSINAAAAVTAMVDGAPVVQQENGRTACTVALDVADATCFSDAPQEEVSAILALYDEGRMVGLSMAPVTFSNGVNEVELAAETDQNVSDYQIFLTGGSASMAPLCPALGDTVTAAD